MSEDSITLAHNQQQAAEAEQKMTPASNSPRASEKDLEQQTETGDEDGPPDGGSKAWMTVAGATLILFATNGYSYAFGVYEDHYTRNFLTNRTPSDISWIGSLQYVMPLLLGVVSGRLFDQGYFYVLSIFGCSIYVICVFMLSLAKKNEFYQVFLSQGVGLGLSLGMVWVPAVTIVSHHFQKRRALAIGIVLSGSAVGAVIFPIMLNQLLQRMSFGEAVRATAYLILGAVFLGNLLIRTRPPAGPKPRPPIGEFFKERSYLLLMFAMFLTGFGLLFPIVYMQLFAIQHGLDANLAFYSLAIINASGIFGRLAGNHLADSVGPITVLIPVAAGTSLSIWLVLVIKNSASLVIISILYGVFSGAYLSLTVAALGSLAEVPSHVGSKTGLGLAIVSLSLLGSSAQGAMLTPMFHWIRPIAFSGSITAAGTIFHIIARQVVAKEKGHQRV